MPCRNTSPFRTGPEGCRLPPYVIVVALDHSEYAEIVLEHAMDQALRHDLPELHFLTVIARSRWTVDDAEHHLADAVLPAFEGIDYADWSIRLHVRRGRPHEEIVAFAGDVRANLIVIGRFGLHHRSGRLGSVASRVLDRASCPTLVIGLTDR
jgi:nucleotide-binding universal stress UspA family protein